MPCVWLRAREFTYIQTPVVHLKCSMPLEGSDKTEGLRHGKEEDPSIRERNRLADETAQNTAENAPTLDVVLAMAVVPCVRALDNVHSGGA